MPKEWKIGYSMLNSGLTKPDQLAETPATQPWAPAFETLHYKYPSHDDPSPCTLPLNICEPCTLYNPSPQTPHPSHYTKTMKVTKPHNIQYPHRRRAPSFTLYEDYEGYKTPHHTIPSQKAGSVGFPPPARRNMRLHDASTHARQHRYTSHVVTRTHKPPAQSSL